MVKNISLLGIIAVFFSSWFYLSYYQNEDDRTLKIYGYSNFVSSWGPGPKLAELYQSHCQCQLELLDMGDSALVLEKLKTGHLDADIIIGLDQLLISKAKNIKWHPILHKQNSDFFRFENPNFLAISWAPFSFIYRKSEFKSPPQSFKDLLDKKLKKSVALLDPRTSSVGLQFLAAVFLTMTDEEAEKFLISLKPNIHSISPSWSTAYGLFKNKEVKLVFSYATSAVYHWIEEENEDYQVMSLNRKHPIQIELIGIPQTCKNCDEAQKFSEFLVGSEAQKIIMNKNFMMPIQNEVLKKTPFEKIKLYETIELSKYSNFNIEVYLQKWKNIFSH